MSKVKFYSEYDMTCENELCTIIDNIKTKAIEKDWSITDIMDFYNTCKYFSFQIFKDYVVRETNVDIKDYEKKIKEKIGLFISENRDNFLDLYDMIDFDNKDDFFEILEKYKVFLAFDNTKFSKFIDKKNVHIYMVLKHKKLTEAFDEVIKDKMVSDSKSAEIILSKVLKDDILYLPKSITIQDISQLIDDYISSESSNINVLRKIVNFPSNNEITISDRTKLNAKRKLKEEENKILSNGSSISTGVSISYPIDQVDAIIINMNGIAAEADIRVSRKWIEENLDYPTLWNNFIYIFNFVDEEMRLALDSKISERGVFESVIHTEYEHIYFDSFAFQFKEMLSNAEIFSYINVLQIYKIRFEEMIEWFFNEYLQTEFCIKDFIVKMPSENASYFEKCRTILPEIDRILKQYNMLVEDGYIEQELIQMSSSSLKVKEIKSFANIKYVYSSSEWYKTASYLLFSGQSMIFYLPLRKGYENFFKLILSESVNINEFQNYQLSGIKWLIENNILFEDEKGLLSFKDFTIIFILKELFYEEVISYWNCTKDVQKKIDELLEQGLITCESSLFSINEQDYFDYYLNKSKFANGYDIRNRYLHGTNTNDEQQYIKDYNTILKLLTIIIIKINDDICINEDHIQKSSEN